MTEGDRMSVQGRMPAFTLLVHRDGASPRRNDGVHWERKLSVLLSFFVWKTTQGGLGFAGT